MHLTRGEEQVCQRRNATLRAWNTNGCIFRVFPSLGDLLENTYFITFLKFLLVVFEMNLTKHTEEKRKMNKASVAKIRKEGEHYGAAPAFLQYWVSVTSPLLARPTIPPRSA